MKAMYMVEFDPVLKLLEEVVNDRTVPKNIRSAAEDSKNLLNSNESLELKISTAIHTLDNIINDPNMPMYARTKIWNIVSMLEQTRRELD
jgi:uncharacterized protein (UPF0147 family)